MHHQQGSAELIANNLSQSWLIVPTLLQGVPKN